MSTQDRILNHLKKRPITPLQALDKYQCFRLADVIYKLRNKGYPIETETIERKGKRFARYRLLA